MNQEQIPLIPKNLKTNKNKKIFYLINNGIRLYNQNNTFGKNLIIYFGDALNTIEPRTKENTIPFAYIGIIYWIIKNIDNINGTTILELCVKKYIHLLNCDLQSKEKFDEAIFNPHENRIKQIIECKQVSKEHRTNILKKYETEDKIIISKLKEILRC